MPDYSSTDQRPTAQPFSSKQLARQLRVDTALRLVIVAIAFALLMGALSANASGSLISFIAILLAVGGWMFVNGLSNRVSVQIPRLTFLIDTDPAAAEQFITQLLAKRPLLRWVRLAIYHRLAILRHRQHRFHEAADICELLLRYRVGPARDARANVLLMLTEARLECRDVLCAYHTLTALSHTRLSLIEHLQRIALQTRYELMIGSHAAALRGADHKIQLIELMPAPQCGAVHAMLATAADHQGQSRLAAWLWQRAELLCTPSQFQNLRQGGFGITLTPTPGA